MIFPLLIAGGIAIGVSLYLPLKKHRRILVMGIGFFILASGIKAYEFSIKFPTKVALKKSAIWSLLQVLTFGVAITLFQFIKEEAKEELGIFRK